MNSLLLCPSKYKVQSRIVKKTKQKKKFCFVSSIFMEEENRAKHLFHRQTNEKQLKVNI